MECKVRYELQVMGVVITWASSLSWLRAEAFMNEASMTRAAGATPYFMQGPARKQLPKNGTTEIFGWSKGSTFCLGGKQISH
jgi:hypothetical protein